MLTELAALPAALHICLGFVLGLMVGSFLNVVIYRFPKQLQYHWTAQSFEWLNKKPYSETEPPGIVSPPSHCGNCKAPVKAWQNIPIVSFMLLGGKCASCKVPISWRYPLVELLTGLLCAVVVWRFGWSVQAIAGIVLTWVLVSLSFIDFDHKLLPDEIVLPTLWLGLAMSLLPVFANTAQAIIGSIAGYLAFWIVFQIFLKVTGKEGMGYGDFKLLALLGAWLGWEYLPQIILISTVIGSIAGISLMVIRKASKELAIPFGPYIALGGWIALIWGSDINIAYMSSLGL